MTLLTVLAPHHRDGFNAGAAGLPASDNPWKPGTVGHLAWSLGWDIGRRSRRWSRLVRLAAVLAVVVKGRRE